MKRSTWVGIAIAILALLRAPTAASVANAPATVKWNTQAIIKVTLTPNYYTGFGSVLASFTTQPAPTHGPGATGVGEGAVDFGSVLAGDSYLYKYAAHLSVTTNDPSGFYVYGEGAANFYNTADGSSQVLSQTLYYLPSGATSDSNTGFSPGLPLYDTNGSVSGNGQFTTPSITYASYPNPIDTSAAAAANLYYDYQLKVPAAATSGLYYVWIVYTVVAR